MNLTDTYTGITVCDMGQGVAAPHATMLLAQFGADVVKVEPPEGDWSRQLGDTFGDHCAHSWQFNLGKRSFAVDVKSSNGKQSLRELIARSNIFVESFRPGVAARLGLSYEDVRAVRPDIIYASMSGFGQTGPYSQRGTVDTLIQGFSGMMVMNRTPDGAPHRQGMVAVDVLTGLYLYGLLTTALARHEALGEGCYLDVSLMQAAAAFQSAKIAENYLTHGVSKPMYMPSGILPASDGSISLSTMRPEHFGLVCKALNAAHIETDPRFADHALRLANGRALMSELTALTCKRTTVDLLAALHMHGVLSERIQSYDQWMSDEHVLRTRAYQWVDNGAGSKLPLVRLPGVEAPLVGSQRTQAPHVGEHTAAILSENAAAFENNSK